MHILVGIFVLLVLLFYGLQEELLAGFNQIIGLSNFATEFEDAEVLFLNGLDEAESLLLLLELSVVEVDGLVLAVDEGLGFAGGSHLHDEVFDLGLFLVELSFGVDIVEAEGDVYLGKIADSLLFQTLGKVLHDALVAVKLDMALVGKADGSKLVGVLLLVGSGELFIDSQRVFASKAEVRLLDAMLRGVLALHFPLAGHLTLAVDETSDFFGSVYGKFKLFTRVHECDHLELLVGIKVD